MGQRILFPKQPRIVAVSTIAGTKECEGIVGRYVETALSDDMFGESTFEKAECKMLSHVIDGAIANAKLMRDQVGMIVSGDLLNQIISASFAARDFSVPLPRHIRCLFDYGGKSCRCRRICGRRIL